MLISNLYAKEENIKYYKCMEVDRIGDGELQKCLLAEGVTPSITGK
jgi:hypothetical protein